MNPREFSNFPRAQPEGNFQIPEGIFKFTTCKGIYCEFTTKNRIYGKLFYYSPEDVHGHVFMCVYITGMFGLGLLSNSLGNFSYIP